MKYLFFSGYYRIGEVLLRLLSINQKKGDCKLFFTAKCTIRLQQIPSENGEGVEHVASRILHCLQLELGFCCLKTFLSLSSKIFLMKNYFNKNCYNVTRYKLFLIGRRKYLIVSQTKKNSI